MFTNALCEWDEGGERTPFTEEGAPQSGVASSS